MLSSRKAAYIIQEIRNIPFYESLIVEHRKELEENDRRKEDLSSPKSPQGHEDIGAGNQMSIDSIQDRMVELFDQDIQIEEKIKRLTDRLMLADDYRVALYNTDYADFVKDYFSGTMTLYDIEEKYSISNAYDKMIRIIKNYISALGV